MLYRRSQPRPTTSRGVLARGEFISITENRYHHKIVAHFLWKFHLASFYCFLVMLISFQINKVANIIKTQTTENNASWPIVEDELSPVRSGKLNWIGSFSSFELSWVQFSAVHWTGDERRRSATYAVAGSWQSSTGEVIVPHRRFSSNDSREESATTNSNCVAESSRIVASRSPNVLKIWLLGR